MPVLPQKMALPKVRYGRKQMARQIVFSSKAARPPPAYSQAVKAAGLVFVSGTAPTDPNTGAIKGKTVQEQTAQCLTKMTSLV
jgi:2-iminobutanoate/2-iminopropanoate deaminase